jgi:hypothetical protein
MLVAGEGIFSTSMGAMRTTFPRAAFVSLSVFLPQNHHHHHQNES